MPHGFKASLRRWFHSEFAQLFVCSFCLKGTSLKRIHHHHLFANRLRKWPPHHVGPAADCALTWRCAPKALFSRQDPSCSESIDIGGHTLNPQKKRQIAGNHHLPQPAESPRVLAGFSPARFHMRSVSICISSSAIWFLHP